MRKLGVLPALFFAFLFLFTSEKVFADDGEVARLDSKQGKVEGLFQGEKDFKEIDPGAIFKAGDIIRTARYARAEVVFKSGVFLRLASGTTLQFQSEDPNDPGRQKVNMDQGKGYFLGRGVSEAPNIYTPAVTTAIRGTEFVVEADHRSTTVSVINGQVDCRNKHGQVLLGAGEQSYTEIGKAPTKAVIVNQNDAVQWALNYPVSIKPAVLRDPGLSPTIEQSLAAYQRGDLEAALGTLDSAGSSAEALISKSAMQLSLGDVEGAQRSMASAENLLRSRPDSALSARLHAQKAIVAIVQNDRDLADRLCREALALDPASEEALLAQSYLAQSRFDLGGAAEALKRIVAANPNQAFALARLAEIKLSSGEVQEAQGLAAQALAIDPGNNYALSVRGFIHLIRDESHEARAIFSKLVDANSSLALPHLGLGLAIIRQGDLEGGRVHLQKAAHLEPTTAIYRSYLGKAFFEEEKEDLAGTEYNEAMRLDPRDPTPYLYRAYNQLSANKVVAALDDVEKSIELNNNRAVYRSSLLLDQDLGVRSAGLSEIFTSLGFDQAARVEAIKSINRDYGNFSAHRLLAESYTTIQLNDASLSEREVADLLSPLSFNLIRSPAASSQASLNDYNALFDRSQQRTELASTLSTYDDQIAPYVAQAGKGDRYGYYMAYESDMRDGTRGGNHLQSHLLSGAVQYQLDYENRFIAKGKGLYRDFKDSNLELDQTKFEDYEFALGYNRRMGPASHLLLQTNFSNERNNFKDHFTTRIAEILETSLGELYGLEDELLLDEFSRERVKSSRSSAQYIYDSDLVSLVVGSQIYFSDVEREESSDVLDDAFALFSQVPYTVRSQAYPELNSQDYYTYTSWHLADWVDINLGANYSEIELEEREVPPFLSDSRNRSRLNPKFGATFYPTSTTTVRTAYFETLRKSSLEDMTALEPTLVGGINQRFTDISGTRARNYGAGIDQKVPGFAYFGIEGIHRDVIEDFSSATTNVLFDFDNFETGSDASYNGAFEDHQDQDLVNAYYYQVFSKQWVGTADWQYSMVERTDPDLYQEYETNKLRFGLRYFDPTGLFTFCQGTWRDQDVTGGDFFESGGDTFWVFDLGIGYRIPKRHGSIQLKITNIFDEEFNYDQTLGLEEVVRPDLGATLLATFNF
ncbi:MAG: hypothetical protein DCC75_04415 [Proteobacteria bacterium]|nr:MAG: hypothetical protein DCC75_04415 [Pseudomonadota bacterium]